MLEPDDALVMWTIYDHPDDYPKHWVLRTWTIRDGQDPLPSVNVLLANSLEAARDLVPPGKVRMTGDPDPSIAETWI